MKVPIGDGERRSIWRHSLAILLLPLTVNACNLRFDNETPPATATSQTVESTLPAVETPTPTAAVPDTLPTIEETEMETSEPTRTTTPTADLPEPTTAVTGAQSCSETWFFDNPVELDDRCPQPAIASQAAAQPFEQGMMIWLEQPGGYHILTNQILFEGEPRKVAYRIDDPLDIVADTSADYVPPAGLFAPTSGFGLVWRGDVAQSPGFQNDLGWATAREFAYEASYQCEVGSVSGGRTWRFCFLLAPGGDVIVFHALDGWLWLSEWP